MMTELANSVSLLLIVYDDATALFSILGMVGAGFILASTRLRIGALLMLVGALVVQNAPAAYPLLLSVVMAPIVNATGIPVPYPGAGYYVISLAPALGLLVGAVLSFVARPRRAVSPAPPEGPL
jgi:hypothetical protein